MKEIHTRKTYDTEPLHKRDLASDPFDQFLLWFEEALAKESHEPNAMVVATATKEGKPSSRNVLLKKFDRNGFVFFTHYESKKGIQISENPNISATFYWPTLVRQVCIEGIAIKTSREESEAYFTTRPRENQLGAWTSKQDTPLASRQELDKAYAHYEKKFHGKNIPLPEYWGGIRIVPYLFDFWQGRSNRLSDRFHYIQTAQEWKLSRISP